MKPEPTPIHEWQTGDTGTLANNGAKVTKCTLGISFGNSGMSNELLLLTGILGYKDARLPETGKVGGMKPGQHGHLEDGIYVLCINPSLSQYLLKVQGSAPVVPAYDIRGKNVTLLPSDFAPPRPENT